MRFTGVEYGGFWRRFLGFVVDNIIILLAALIPIIVVSLIIFSSAPDVAFTQEQLQEQEDTEANAGLAAVAIYFLISIGYSVLMNANGGTLGKRVLGMRLEDSQTRENIGLGKSLVRYIVSIVSSIVFRLGYLWCIWDEDKQTWHDKAAGSVVVRT